MTLKHFIAEFNTLKNSMVFVIEDPTLKVQWETVTAPDTLCSANKHPEKSCAVANYKNTQALLEHMLDKPMIGVVTALKRNTAHAGDS